MPKTLTEISSMARSHTRTAINVLVSVMRCKNATAAGRVSAANSILDRGWGKASQPLENGGDGALELIHRIDVKQPTGGRDDANERRHMAGDFLR